MIYPSWFVYKYLQLKFVDIQDLSDSGAGPTRRLPDRSQLGHIQQGRGDCADHEQVNAGIFYILKTILLFTFTSSATLFILLCRRSAGNEP
jgi:hypothetical protein